MSFQHLINVKIKKILYIFYTILETRCAILTYRTYSFKQALIQMKNTVTCVYCPLIGQCSPNNPCDMLPTHHLWPYFQVPGSISDRVNFQHLPWSLKIIPFQELPQLNLKSRQVWSITQAWLFLTEPSSLAWLFPSTRWIFVEC